MNKISVDGIEYDIHSYRTRFGKLMEYQDNGVRCSCVDNGQDTAIEFGFSGKPEFDDVAMIFAVRTAEYEYDIMLKC